MVEKRIKAALKKKTVILGVGNPERRDDGVGVYLASRLMGRVNARVLNCEEIPECFTDTVREVSPDTVMILDAVHMNKPPGTIAVFEEADILKTAHHGSNTSTCEKFIKAVDPGIAIICVGENKWGHPSEEVLQRLRNFGIDILTTKEAGDIKFSF